MNCSYIYTDRPHDEFLLHCISNYMLLLNTKNIINMSMTSSVDIIDEIYYIDYVLIIKGLHNNNSIEMEKVYNPLIN